MEDENKPFLTMKEIDSIFAKEHLIDVTEDIKYYLYQATTIFRVEKESSGPDPILLVKGEWRGGLNGPLNEANMRTVLDATQIINVSFSEDHSHVNWQRKQGISKEVSLSISPRLAQTIRETHMQRVMNSSYLEMINM